jgi:hypothetical protein
MYNIVSKSPHPDSKRFTYVNRQIFCSFLSGPQIYIGAGVMNQNSSNEPIGNKEESKVILAEISNKYNFSHMFSPYPLEKCRRIQLTRDLSSKFKNE